MGENSKIAWTDHTFSPWWGCTRVSPGCTNCYADREARRWGFQVWDGRSRRYMSEKYWKAPLKWNANAAAEGIRRRVFCASMCDVFEDLQDCDRDEECRQRLWELIDQTPNLDWLLLTKRPENMPSLAPRSWADGWPQNVWALTTAENQAMADLRVPLLLRVPAVVRGLSCEPLLGLVDLLHVRAGQLCPNPAHTIDVLRGGTWDLRTGFVRPGVPEFVNHSDMPGTINWVIAGGESGPHARPMHPKWVRSIRDQCQLSDIPFFFKQWGEWLPKCQESNEDASPMRSDESLRFHCWQQKPFPQYDSTLVGKKRAGRLLDGREWNEFPEVKTR